MKNGKLELLFCTDGIFPHAIGGMQRHSRLLIEELAKDADLRIIVVHPHAGQHIFNDLPDISEIAVDPGKSSGNYLLDCYNYSKKVYAVAAAHPHAVIYSQGLSVWYRISRIGQRLIINPHGLEPYQTISLRDKMITAPFRMIFGYLFRQASAIVSLGGKLTGILQQLTGDKKNKIVILPNAVNVTAPLSRTWDGAPLKFLFVGRFAFNKGIGVLLETIAALNASGYENKLFFNLVGKGPLYDEFREKYRADNIHFAGFTDDNQLNELYRTNDVFILPTLFEGMPTVVLEAMCYSMPVIVTDVGATRELVDEQNGFIIEKNSVDSLKEAIIKYFSMSAAERASLGDHSYRKVRDNFTWPVVAQKHKQVFQRLKNKMEEAQQQISR